MLGCELKSSGLVGCPGPQGAVSDELILKGPHLCNHIVASASLLAVRCHFTESRLGYNLDPNSLQEQTSSPLTMWFLGHKIGKDIVNILGPALIRRWHPSLEDLWHYPWGLLYVVDALLGAPFFLFVSITVIVWILNLLILANSTKDPIHSPRGLSHSSHGGGHLTSRRPTCLGFKGR
jgi:hypothetical protein